MLVLSRNKGESIRIGTDVFVTVIDIRGSTIRIGINAPRELEIVRTELDNPKEEPATIN